jgi:hypothetical protein
MYFLEKPDRLLAGGAARPVTEYPPLAVTRHR